MPAYVPEDVTSRRTRLTTAALALVLTAGCGNTTTPEAETEATTGPSSVPTTTDTAPAKAYTVEQLATELGCTPQFQGKTKDFRQATCAAEGTNFVLLDFETAEGQRAWLDTAIMYGGIYLSGERWVLSGESKQYMEDLRTTLGGTIEESPGQGS
jgi:hypothetical protein